MKLPRLITRWSGAMRILAIGIPLLLAAIWGLIAFFTAPTDEDGAIAAVVHSSPYLLVAGFAFGGFLVPRLRELRGSLFISVIPSAITCGASLGLTLYGNWFIFLPGLLFPLAYFGLLMLGPAASLGFLLILAADSFVSREPWQCAKCRYDLRGLDGMSDGVCPECGTPTERET